MQNRLQLLLALGAAQTRAPFVESIQGLCKAGLVERFQQIIQRAQKAEKEALAWLKGLLRKRAGHDRSRNDRLPGFFTVSAKHFFLVSLAEFSILDYRKSVLFLAMRAGEVH